MSYTDVFGNSTLPPADYGYRALAITADTTLLWPFNTDDATVAVAKIMDVSCASGNSLILPDATLVSTGEDFLVRNIGANALLVKKSDGTLVSTVNAGSATYFYLTDNTTSAGVYGAVAYGVGSSFVDAATLVGYGIKAVSGTLNQSHPVTATSSGITVDSTYRAKLINFTGGAATLSLTDASTLGDDFFFLLRNSGSGTVTVDPSGSQTVDGQSAISVQPGESMMLFCSGSAWFSVGYGRSTLYQFTQLVKDVSAAGTFTLTSAEASNKLITFIGTPASAVTVIVPAIVSVYYTYNNCSTAQSVTVKTATGSGVAIDQTGRAILLCDGTDVISAQSITASSSISLVDGSSSNPALNFSSQTNMGLYKYGSQGLGISANGTNIAQFEPTRAVITQPQDYVKMSTTAGAPAYSEGNVFYDSAAHTLAYHNDASGVTVNVGQEQLVRIRNNTGSTLTDGQLVYINGALGNLPTVALAKADAEATSAGTLGMVTHTINNGADGYITISGVVNNLNTNAYPDGTILYLSASVAGGYTSTEPTAPHHRVTIGYITRQHVTQGSILVRIDNGYELEELHNVLITTPSNDQALLYESSTGLWKNKTLSSALSYVQGPASSVDSEIALFDSTTGKLIKRATTTGILKGTSGVLSAATAGTDYLAPPSGTAILKANSGGALANATAGTDYAAPGTASTWTATQTFKGVTDTVYTITDGAAFEINPANGAIQVVTLGAARTPAATNFVAGQSVLLGIDDGTAYTITWTTVNPTWVKAGGAASAPTLATTGYTWVLLWKVGSTIYAANVGSP